MSQHVSESFVVVGQMSGRRVTVFREVEQRAGDSRHLLCSDAEETERLRTEANEPVVRRGTEYRIRGRQEVFRPIITS